MTQLKVVRKLANKPDKPNLIQLYATKENAVPWWKYPWIAEIPCREIQKFWTIEAAIIQNQQMKEGIMNTIVSHLNKH